MKPKSLGASNLIVHQDSADNEQLEDNQISADDMPLSPQRHPSMQPSPSSSR